MHNNSSTKPTKSGWVNLYDNQGRIQANYNPRLRLLLIAKGKQKTIHDLKKHDTSCESKTDVLG